MVSSDMTQREEVEVLVSWLVMRKDRLVGLWKSMQRMVGSSTAFLFLSAITTSTTIQRQGNNGEMKELE